MLIQPYLLFDGNCGEAFRRYHELLGGDLQMQKMSGLIKPFAPRLEKESAGRVLDRAVEILESYVKDAKPDSIRRRRPRRHASTPGKRSARSAAES